MKKFFFYSSIFILCILVWLNKKNKEGIGEGDTIFKGMTAEDLRNIYTALEKLSEKTTTVTTMVPNVIKNVIPSNAATTVAGDAISTGVSTFNTIDEQTAEEDPYKKVTTTIKRCPTHEEVIDQLLTLNITDSKFNQLVNRPDGNKEKAYTDITNALKTLPTIPYACRYLKREHRTHQYFPEEICMPKCQCIQDINICKNFKYLYNTLDDNEEDFNNILRITDSYLFNSPAPKGAADLTDLKYKLKDFFGLRIDTP